MQASILERIREQGPLTVAEFMELALYDPGGGYYARATRRSGRSGDFYTSVDVGPLFGELLATLVVRVWRAVRAATGRDDLTVIEAAAGNGRLMRDVLDAVAREVPACYAALRVVLVERSAAARAAQPAVLGAHADRTTSLEDLPRRTEGALLFANELLDAMPVHRVLTTAEGLREVYVDAVDGRLAQRLGSPSTPALAEYFQRLGLTLAHGIVADVGLAAFAWVQRASRLLDPGYLLIVDYGHEARGLFSPLHAEGTLRSFRRHLVDAARGGGAAQPAWLQDPAGQDLTADVDFTSVRLAAEGEGCVVAADCDQTRFLLDLGLADRLVASAPGTMAGVRRRLAAKSLVAPGGLGSTHRVLLLARGLSPTAWRGGDV